MPRQDKSRVSNDSGDASNAGSQARALAEPGDWLAQALDHHEQIRAAFARAAQTPANGSRIAAMKAIALVLTGHSLAEEVVLYPALAEAEPKHADRAYEEQTEAKIQMAKLEQIDPAGADWLEQLQAIQTAVLEHMAEEERVWFIELKNSSANQAKLSARYKEEFERYTRTGIIATNAAWDGPPRPVPAA